MQNIFLFEKIPAEFWWVICVVATVAGGRLIYSGSPSRKVLGGLLILASLGILFKYFHYSQVVLGHIGGDGGE